jgi:hypothetical protein
MEEYPMSDLLILEFLRLRRPELNIVGWIKMGDLLFAGPAVKIVSGGP